MNDNCNSCYIYNIFQNLIIEVEENIKYIFDNSNDIEVIKIFVLDEINKIKL